VKVKKEKKKLKCFKKGRGVFHSEIEIVLIEGSNIEYGNIEKWGGV